MGRPTPEIGGGTPQNQGLSEFKVLPEQKGVGPRVQKAEEPKQQPSDADREAAKQLLGKHWGKTVFEGPFRVPRPLPKNPGEQRGEGEPFQPNPAEQQASERLGKPPPEEAASQIDNSVQEQDEPQAGGKEDPDDLDFDIDFKPLPPATWVGPFGRLRPKRINSDDQK